MYEYSTSEYRNMSNEELIAAEAALDYREPDILEEIFRRAEEFEPGITELYNESFCSSTLNSDEIFSRAVSHLV